VTAPTTITRALRSRDAGGAGEVVECASCGVALRPAPDVDEDVALGTFLQHHPVAPEAIHRFDLPAGWSAVTVLPD
jgi:hypothetical protein